MYQFFPGTTIEAGSSMQSKPDIASDVLKNVFAAGGLVLSQVTALTGLEYYTVQNWVKRGFVSPPVKKQYSKRQFCRIVLINMLKDSMQIEKVLKLLSYINGVLDDESDDLIDDSELYNYYVNLVFSDDGTQSPDKLIENVLSGYAEPVPGAKIRLSKVLHVIYYAGKVMQYQHKCDEILNQLG